MKKILLSFICLFFTIGAAHARSAENIVMQENIKTAIFAGGCFWCMEKPYDKIDGVISTVSGYSGGAVDNPTYEQVSSGATGHYEVLQVTYDASKISYDKLLDIFWRNVDPLDAGGQFCDRGGQYRAAIFYSSEEEKQIAEKSKAKHEQILGQKIVTEILPAKTFYPAEDYHQDYYLKNPVRYKFYRWNCGRDQRLEEVWGGK